jgi:putative flavoprotein involved in K+ transport
VSPHIVQMHAGEYRHAGNLPEGAVLVVGSGQSGVQIAEDLLYSGKKVFLSTSMVARIPRRYRGKDVLDWFTIAGFMDQRVHEVDDPDILTMAQPQLSGMGPRGKSVSLQSLAAKGAVILGKAIHMEEDLVSLQPDAAAHIHFGDDYSQRVKGMIDEYIGKARIDAPAPEPDPDDAPDEHAQYASHETSLNLKEKGITAIIWSTGFTGDFSYIKLPVFDDYGHPQHQEGLTDIDGLYFLGLPWMRKRKSGLIYGIEEDAEFICRRIGELSEERKNPSRTSEKSKKRV